MGIQKNLNSTTKVHHRGHVLLVPGGMEYNFALDAASFLLCRIDEHTAWQQGLYPVRDA